MAAPARLWRIHRIYLDRIGAPAARFRDVWLDFASRTGNPLDTILWMRNGGGKSTLIALICASIRPARDDYLATADTDRHLEDCILGSDTAHIVIEWMDPDGRRMVTGAVYEWADRIAPGDPNASWERLQQRWYAFTPSRPHAEIERLPFLDSEQHPTTQKAFTDAVAALPADADPIVILDQNQGSWAKALRDRGLDPGLFTAILKINSSEGGIEKHFKFSTTDDFVKYLLSLVTDTTTVTAVSKLLGKHRASIARHPRLRTEVDFTGEAVDHLRDLVKDQGELTAATIRREQVRRRGRELAAALTAAAARAGDLLTALTERTEQHRERQKQAGQQAGAHDALRREYQWRAAALTDAAAQQQRDAADRAVTDTTRAHQAWQLVPAVIKRAALTTEIAGLHAQQQADEADAEPARRAYQRAAAALMAVLERSGTELEAEISTAQQTAAAAADDRGIATSAASDAQHQTGALTTLAEQLRRSLDRFDAAVARAVRDGHLHEGADLASAYADCQQGYEQILAQLDEELPRAVSALEADRRPDDDEHHTLSATVADLDAQHRILRAEHDPLAEEISRLSVHPRLTLLAQTDTVDPLAANRTLSQALSGEMLDGDLQRIDLAVADIDDERALKALAQDLGLLPASLDLARAAQVLQDAAIPASTGWHYLADAVAPHLWVQAIDTAPHLVAGLLVHDPQQLSAAREHLHTADLQPGTTVQISTTRALQDAIDDASAPVDGFVVPPAAALFDRDAVVPEIERRQAAKNQRATQINDLQAARHDDQRLLSQLAALAEKCPPGHLEHLRVELDRVTAAITAAHRRLDELAILRAGHDARAVQLNHRRSALEAEQRRMADRARTLRTLTEQQPDADAARQRLAELPGELDALNKTAEAARAEADRHDAILRAANLAADSQSRTLTQYRREISRLSDAAADTTADAGSVSLADARSTFEVAADAHRRRASHDVLEARIEVLNKQAGELSAAITDADPHVHRLADELAATPAAADPAVVREHQGAAERAMREAERDAALKGHAAQAARTELDARTRHRPAAADLMLPVTDADHLDQAQALIADAVTQRDHHQNEADAIAQAIVGMQVEGERLRDDADQFTQLAGDIIDDDAHDPTTSASAAPYPGTIADARAAAPALRKELSTAERAFASARTTMIQRGHTISRWANEPRFQHVTPEVRDRFTADDTTSLAADADTLITELGTYRANLTGQINDVESDKQIVVTALCQEARDSLKILQRAQSQAQLPPGLGEHLKNRRFLDVSPRPNVDTTPAVVRSRITTLVDTLVQTEGRPLPDGRTLSWQAVSAAVGGPGNFIARVLKPSTNLTDDRQPVERMGKWSGGEKVTISLLLFCMLARLRAASRGNDVPGLGVLPMDNPLGSANYVAFLDLQRRVAAANGIQLIFLSGLADMRAIGRFPNVIRMKNTHNHDRDRTYAQVDERDLTDDPLAATITTTRLTYPMQESLL